MREGVCLFEWYGDDRDRHVRTRSCGGGGGGGLPQPPADAELDRNDDGIVALQIIGSEAADEIEFALDLRKALEQTLGVIKVIDESERLRRIRADVKTDGRPGPIDRTLAQIGRAHV